MPKWELDFCRSEQGQSTHLISVEHCCSATLEVTKMKWSDGVSNKCLPAGRAHVHQA